MKRSELEAMIREIVEETVKKHMLMYENKNTKASDEPFKVPSVNILEWYKDSGGKTPLAEPEFKHSEDDMSEFMFSTFGVK